MLFLFLPAEGICGRVTTVFTRIDAAPGAENINRRRPRIDAACTVRRLFEEKSISDKS